MAEDRSDDCLVGACLPVPNLRQYLPDDCHAGSAAGKTGGKTGGKQTGKARGKGRKPKRRRKAGRADVWEGSGKVQGRKPKRRRKAGGADVWSGGDGSDEDNDDDEAEEEEGGECAGQPAARASSTGRYPFLAHSDGGMAVATGSRLRSIVRAAHGEVQGEVRLMGYVSSFVRGAHVIPHGIEEMIFDCYLQEAGWDRRANAHGR